ncbi:hypothetical protein [Streptomyces luteolus]|uniref:Integrase n=1 Tax=Streptomyces luteolus TaxID=3043615 RepID=A0ABT6T2X3_9ACTN|nr:hypothetical protein [Streptomyces sp. B-S-A12]MDI3421765.1 hypothetical protein [Streptomyces sp. B-S-A12]
MKQKLRQARRKPWHITTGPGAQLKMKNELSSALDYAHRVEKLISENWAQHVVLPKYTPPKPLVWTDERVARWREIGEKPDPVMVWTPEQTGEFLDGVADHRLYPMFHLMVFRALRRGESAGLPWAESDPQSCGARTFLLDGQTRELLLFWRRRQQVEKEEWRQRHEEWRAERTAEGKERLKRYDPPVRRIWPGLHLGGRGARTTRSTCLRSSCGSSRSWPCHRCARMTCATALPRSPSPSAST